MYVNKQLHFEWINKAKVRDLETPPPFSPNYTMNRKHADPPAFPLLG